MIPSPWPGLVLALACFRVVRLIGWDDLPPVERLRNWVVGASWTASGTSNSLANVTGEQPTYVWKFRHPTLRHFLQCAYCQGFWVSVVVYLCWVWFPTQVMYAAAPFALSAAVGMMARRLDP